MPPTPNPLHAVYSEKMWVTGHGFPLWDGEPEDGERELELGMVGYLDYGKFWLLFDTMKPDTHEDQKDGVPSEFEVLTLPNSSISKPWERIKTNVLTSQSVHEVRMEASANAGVPNLEDLGSAGAGYKFVTKSKSGAFLFLDTPAFTRVISNRRHVTIYLRQHFDRWMEFANMNRGLELKPNQVFFVSGTTKTTRWACGAFEGSSRSRAGFLNAQVMNIGSVDVSMSFSTEDAVRTESNYGPSSMGSPGRTIHFPANGNKTNATADLPRNQCIFFHYYKARRRILGFPRLFAAAAGPHELPDSEDPDDSSRNDAVQPGYPSSDEGSDDTPISSVPYDPVEFLLDYILAHSEADIAIACDRDVYALFHGREFPSDIPAALDALQPTIDVDEDGAGTVDVSHRVLMESESDAASAASAASAVEGVPQIEAAPGPVVESVENISQQSETSFEAQQASQAETSSEARTEPLQDVPTVPQPEASDESQPRAQLDSEISSVAAFSDLGLTPGIGPSDAPAAAPYGYDDDDEFEGLTEEEARLRREQKMPVLQWQPAANGHTGAVTSLAYSHDSKLLATGSDDTSIVIWDTSNQTIVRKWDAHTDVVWGLAFSPDDKRLASAGADSNVMVWSVETGECLATMTGHEETIHAMAWSADGKWIASGSDDMSVRLWDAETYEQKTVFEGHAAMVTFVRFSHDGRWLASGAADYCSVLWDVGQGTVHKVLRGHKGMLWHADFDADDQRIVTCSDDGSARVWSVETGEMLVNIHEHQGPVWNVVFSPDGTRVLTASSDSTMRLCDSFKGERKLALDGHESMINTACFSPDGKYVASASCDNTARLWRVADGKPQATFNEHDDKVTLVMFSPDGDTLASGSDDGTVRIRLVNEWDPDRAEQDNNGDEGEAEEHGKEDIK